jgi:hypothetical protein
LHQVVVLFRGAHQPAASFGLLERRRCAVAYASAEKVFGLLTGGSHPVSLDSALELISVMNIVRGSVVWEIGCGVPVLAAAMSSVTRNAVLCTDIGDTFLLLMGVSVTRMEKRIVDRSLELATDIMPTRFTDECLDTYVDGLPPFQEREDDVDYDDLLDLLTYLREQALDAPAGGDDSLFDVARYRFEETVTTTPAAAHADTAEGILQKSQEDDIDNDSDYDLQAFNAFAHQDIVVVPTARRTRATMAAATKAAAEHIRDARAPSLDLNLLNSGSEDEASSVSEDEADEDGRSTASRFDTPEGSDSEDDEEDDAPSGKDEEDGSASDAGVKKSGRKPKVPTRPKGGKTRGY